MVALALLASACSADGLETPGEALQDVGSDVPDSGYVIGDVPNGLVLCALATPSPVSFTPPAATLRLYGEAALADPYGGVLVGIGRFEVDIALLDLGPVEEVDIGGAAGFQGGGKGVLGASLETADARSVSWDVDGAVVQVSVRGSDDLDLVALAEAVLVEDDDARLGTDGVPEGFVELGEVYGLEADEEFRFSLDYGAPDAGGDPSELLILIGRTGTAESMNAVRFRATRSRPIDLAVGDPAVFAETDLETGLVSRQVDWITPDGLVLRLFSLALTEAELIAAAESVELIDGGDWRDLVDGFAADECRPQ